MPQASGEVEATEFQGVKLTPISDQGNNALKGTQVIDRDVLQTGGGRSGGKAAVTVVRGSTGIRPRVVADGPELRRGWSFTAKWTGPSLERILDDARCIPRRS